MEGICVACDNLTKYTCLKCKLFVCNRGIEYLLKNILDGKLVLVLLVQRMWQKRNLSDLFDTRRRQQRSRFFFNPRWNRINTTENRTWRRVIFSRLCITRFSRVQKNLGPTDQPVISETSEKKSTWPICDWFIYKHQRENRNYVFGRSFASRSFEIL